MQTIKELRKICQNTRPTIWADFMNSFYYKVSIYLTYFFILLKLKANHITVFSGLISLLGGYLISQDGKVITILGFMCFHLFAILDMCDGELARYNKEGGVEGHFLDWYMHFITSFAFMCGLFIFSFSLFSNKLFLILGLISIFIPIFDKAITSSGWTVIAWTRFRKFNDQKPLDRLPRKIKKNKNIILRRLQFLILHPLMEHWVKLSLLFMGLIDLCFYLLKIDFFNYKFLTLMYIGVIGPFYLYLKIRYLINNNSLIDGYNRLFIDKKKPKLPEADFL